MKLRNKIIAIDAKMLAVKSLLAKTVKDTEEELFFHNNMESFRMCSTEMTIIEEAEDSSISSINKLMLIISDEIPREYRYMDDNYRASYHIKVVAFKKLCLFLMQNRELNIDIKKFEEFCSTVNREIGKKGAICFSQAFHEYLLIVLYIKGPFPELDFALIEHIQLAMEMWKRDISNINLEEHLRHLGFI